MTALEAAAQGGWDSPIVPEPHRAVVQSPLHDVLIVLLAATKKIGLDLICLA